MMKAPAALMLAIVAAALGMTKKTEAHCRAGSWGGCRAPGRHHAGYDYHRRRHYAIELMSDIFSMPLLYMNPLFRQDQLARMDRSAPRYAIDETKDGMMMELTIHVPGVAAKDMTVEVVEGDVLWVRGGRTIRGTGSLTMQSEFDQSFQLDTDVDVENISVTLSSSGTLRVSVPKKARVSNNIPIEIHEEEEEEVDHEELNLTNDETLKRSEATMEGGATVDALLSRDDSGITKEEDSRPGE
jgi:HSP20 family molecular chaperone IbpA